VNYLKERDVTGSWISGSEKPIEQRELSEKEVKEIIRKSLMFPSGYT
jgi:pimeloyl-CoA synthetase